MTDAGLTRLECGRGSFLGRHLEGPPNPDIESRLASLVAKMIIIPSRPFLAPHRQRKSQAWWPHIASCATAGSERA